MWIISQHHIRGVSSLDTTGQQQNDDERVGQRRMAVSSNVGLLETRRRLEDAAAQWLWFALPIKAERVGYGAGPLTWLRQRRHKDLRRAVHICLLDHMPEGGMQSRFSEFWINERSRVCCASLNGPVEEADVVWVYCKDPIPPGKKGELLQALDRTRPGVPVVNHPEVYNAYHEEGTFAALAEAGVGVPRTNLGQGDVGRTPAVYKTEGGHGHTPKIFSRYEGHKPGFRAFEFVDSRGADGLYRRYRAYYLLGAVQPGMVLFSDRQNVLVKTMKRRETYEMTPGEAWQIRLIARTLGLGYFAVDYLRRREDDSPVFVDINVYPGVRSKMGAESRKLGYYGDWYSPDTRSRLALGDPSTRPFWDVFDEVMQAFTSGQSTCYHGEPYSRKV